MMKKVFIPIAGFFLLSAAAYAADWQKYGENKFGTFYYDKESVTYTGLGNVARFKTKRVSPDLSEEILRLFEFDCLHTLERTLECEIRHTGTTEPKECGVFDWVQVSPKTFTMNLFNDLCAKRTPMR